jgi:hypothetical protein
MRSEIIVVSFIQCVHSWVERAMQKQRNQHFVVVNVYCLLWNLNINQSYKRLFINHIHSFVFISFTEEIGSSVVIKNVRPVDNAFCDAFYMSSKCAETSTIHQLNHSRIWALPEKPSVVQPLKNFPEFYGTWRFITVFTRALHWSLSWATSIQSIPSYLF